MSAIRPCIISSGAVETGALLAVVGPNGAGKSTLFKGIVGALKPLAGSIERDGSKPTRSPTCRRCRHRPHVPDQRLRHGGDGAVADEKVCSAASAGKDRRVIETAIAAVGLTGFEQRAIGTLSGGQMQRMLFARLLMQDARVIVLDEPFTAIDAKTVGRPFGLVRRWHSEQRTVLAALHDIDLVKMSFPQSFLLAREPVAWGATREVLTAENLFKARRMCEAFDEHAEACARRRRLESLCSTTP